MRVLVAKMDGHVDRSGEAFAPGSIRRMVAVPVTRNFDHRTAPIGKATIVCDGSEVYADIATHEAISLAGLYPCVGGRAIKTHRNNTELVIDEFEVFELSVCESPNADPRIPPIP